MKIKISLITVVYNNATSIENAVQSVLSQNYPNLEYIVIDGGSTDGTIQVIEKYKNQISHFVSESDKGIYDALNKGITLATGDIIGLLHSDDHFAHDQVLNNIGTTFEAQPIDGLYSDLEYIRKGTVPSNVVRHWKSQVFAPELLEKGWMPPHPTLYLKKDVYQKVGIFNTTYRIAADYDFILRVFGQTHYRFHYLPEVTVQMQLGGASNQSLSRIFRKSREDYQIMRKAGYHAFWTLLNKNFSKLGQFFTRDQQ